MFRGIFEFTVGSIDPQRLVTIDQEAFLPLAQRRRDDRTWALKYAGVTAEERTHFDEIMVDYLNSLRGWIRGSGHPGSIEAGITTFFHQVFR